MNKELLGAIRSDRRSFMKQSQRDIKFRAWDIIDKKMWMVATLTWWNTRIDVVDEKNNHQDIHQDNLELMQYTGLKDKNGKEIYEGDIVNWMNSSDPDPWRGIIQWNDHEAKFECIYTRNENRLWLNSPYIEVIGNKYENPELLDSQ